MRPSESGPSRTGNVTSARSWASFATVAALANSWCLASSAAATAVFTVLTACPKSRRSSGGMAPSRCISADTRPFLPSAAMRTSSSVPRSDARAIASSSSALRVSSSGALMAWAPWPDGAGLSPRGSRGSLDEALEGLRLVHGHIGQHLAVELDPGLFQAVDQLAVSRAIGPRGGVDALDPQGAEGALPHLAVAIGVLAGLVDGLLGDADGILAAAVIPLGRLQHLAVAGMGCNAAFHT